MRVIAAIALAFTLSGCENLGRELGGLQGVGIDDMSVIAATSPDLLMRCFAGSAFEVIR